MTNATDSGPSRVDGQPCCSSRGEAGKWELNRCPHRPSVSAQAQSCPRPRSSPHGRLRPFIFQCDARASSLSEKPEEERHQPWAADRGPRVSLPPLTEPLFPVGGAGRRLLPGHEPFPQRIRVLEWPAVDARLQSGSFQGSEYWRRALRSEVRG